MLSQTAQQLLSSPWAHGTAVRFGNRQQQIGLLNEKGGRMLFKRFVAIILCEVLVFLPVAGARAQETSGATQPKTNVPLRDYLQKPYLDLFELTSAPAFSAAEIQAQRQALKKGKEICVKNFKARSKDYQKQIDAARK